MPSSLDSVLGKTLFSHPSQYPSCGLFRKLGEAPGAVSSLPPTSLLDTSFAQGTFVSVDSIFACRYSLCQAPEFRVIASPHPDLTCIHRANMSLPPIIGSSFGSAKMKAHLSIFLGVGLAAHAVLAMNNAIESPGMVNCYHHAFAKLSRRNRLRS